MQDLAWTMAGVRHASRLYSLLLKQNLQTNSKGNFHVSAADPPTQFLEIKDEEAGLTREIAYAKSPGPRTPGIIYIPGFMSDKSGIKAVSLYKFCQENGFPYVRYDPSGLGESKGVKITQVTFSHWVRDAREILLRVTEGPQLVVCSSMGGWITSIIAQEHPAKFNSILMIAPGINFHIRYEKELRSQLDEKGLKKYEAGGVVPLYNPDYGSFPLMKAQFDDMRKCALSLEANSLDVTCPVRIIHGLKDKDVPFMESLTLLKALKGPDSHLQYLKDGDHRLASEEKIKLICDKILEMTSPK
ncbi:palmitoyl-protein thioesterase ABHD10, mitochondrial-like isoform X1 [Macrobrachium nipponense]|uniref:palmitoyl-protein thioesterase ABHD10, mitochondrial-like isoform X1 n=2 Tax=Macrobrachium nipponense TaxID=159736 RepID=UPI0030C8AE73